LPELGKGLGYPSIRLPGASKKMDGPPPSVLTKAPATREENVPSFANLTEEQLRILTPEGYDTGRPTGGGAALPGSDRPPQQSARNPREIQPASQHIGKRPRPAKRDGSEKRVVRIQRAPGQPIGIRLGKNPVKKEYFIHFVLPGSASVGKVKVGEFVKSINGVDLAPLDDLLEIPRLFRTKGNVIEMVLTRRLTSDDIMTLDTPRDRTFSPKALKGLSANTKSKHKISQEWGTATVTRSNTAIICIGTIDPEETLEVSIEHGATMMTDEFKIVSTAQAGPHIETGSGSGSLGANVASVVLFWKSMSDEYDGTSTEFCLFLVIRPTRTDEQNSRYYVDISIDCAGYAIDPYWNGAFYESEYYQVPYHAESWPIEGPYSARDNNNAGTRSQSQTRASQHQQVDSEMATELERVKAELDA